MTTRLKLTKKYIDRKLPKSVEKETWIWDTEVLAFGVRLRPNARPVYAMRWKDEANRARKRKIGLVNTLELDAARNIARHWWGEIAAGEDPKEKAAVRRRFKKTISDLVEEVAEAMEAEGRSPKYVRDFRQQMRDYALPVIGDRLIRDVTASDIDRILMRVAAKNALHNRVRAGLSRLFTRACRDRYRPDNPVQGTKKQEEQPRTRLLKDREIDALLAALNRNSGQSSDALRLLWLTGSRPKELLSCRWRDLDLEEGTWTKPAQTVKQKRVQHVSLQQTAVAVFLRIREDADVASPDDWVFPSRSKCGHLTTVKKFARRIFAEAGLPDIRPYDLRKAFTSRLVASGADLRTIMSITGHTQVTVLMKHYAHVMEGKQKAVLEDVFG